MKNFTRFAVYIFAVAMMISLVSCDKDEKEKKIRLKSIVWTEDGESVTMTFSYDNAGNLSKIQYSNGYSEQYTYNGQGKLSREDMYSGDTLEYSILYTWNGNSITRVYSDESDYKAVITINSAGEVLKYERFYLIESQWVNLSYDINTWTSGNLTSAEGYTSDAFFAKAKKVIIRENALKMKWIYHVRPVKNMKGFVKEWQDAFTYDNKNNPLRPFQPFQFNAEPTDYSKNNMLTYEGAYYDSEGTSHPYSGSITYQYNSDGYPSTLNDGEGTGTFTYENY